MLFRAHEGMCSSRAFRLVILGLLTAALGGGAAAVGAAQTMTPAAAHTFVAAQKQFLLDGKPFQVIAGDIDYARVPREYWGDRLRKAKAMGLNTITVYSYWNLHEPRPGVYDFAGQNDIAAFLRAVQQEGLYAIFRPGPYVCAEWELGGYPSWLLKTPAVTLRSQDPRYTAAVSTWFTRLGKEITPLLLKNGGPILAVQVENEYGAFGDDHAYLETVKGQVLASGMGDALLYTSNQGSDLAKGSLPELPAVVNFGSGDARRSFGLLQAFRPDGPQMSGEYWAGWFDKWGEKHHETDGRKEAEELGWMLDQGYSVSIYMFHGGTTFGWMNGADSHTGTDYHPDVTSYDYDAPLEENGSPRYKFGLIRTAIAKSTHQELPPVPAATAMQHYAVAPVERSASLWANLPKPRETELPLSFEDMDQSYGYLLYRTPLTAGPAETLSLQGMHDYAQVYLDRKLVGVLDRRLGGTDLALPARPRDAVLDILVENTGRVNYSHAIRGERTGLTGAATLAGKVLRGWQIFSLPMDDPARLNFGTEPCSGPCFYQTTMHVPAAGDTYLDTRALHKGQMWVEHHNLGRFWSIGPQFALYTPGVWLRQGETTLTFFDLTGEGGKEHVGSVEAPIYGETTKARESQ